MARRSVAAGDNAAHGPQRPQAARHAVRGDSAHLRPGADGRSSGSVAYRAYLGIVRSPPEHYLLFLARARSPSPAIFPMFSLYEPQRGASVAEELRRLVFAWILMAALAGGAIFATKMGDTYSRVWVSAWLVGGFVLRPRRCACRCGWRCARLRLRGLNQRHVAIVGAGTLGPHGRRRASSQSPWAGFNVVGFYDDDPATRRHVRRRSARSIATDRMPARRRRRAAASTRSGSRCRFAPTRASARS